MRYFASNPGSECLPVCRSAARRECAEMLFFHSRNTRNGDLHTPLRQSALQSQFARVRNPQRLFMLALAACFRTRLVLPAVYIWTVV